MNEIINIKNKLKNTLTAGYCVSDIYSGSFKIDNNYYIINHSSLTGYYLKVLDAKTNKTIKKYEHITNWMATKLIKLSLCSF